MWGGSDDWIEEASNCRQYVEFVARVWLYNRFLLDYQLSWPNCWATQDLLGEPEMCATVFGPRSYCTHQKFCVHMGPVSFEHSGVLSSLSNSILCCTLNHYPYSCDFNTSKFRSLVILML